MLNLLQYLRQVKQTKAPTDLRTEAMSYFPKRCFSNQCIPHGASPAIKKPSHSWLPACSKLRQCMGSTGTLPWDWSLQSGHAENPESPGPPPSGHWCHAASPRRQLQSFERKGLHPSDTCEEARTNTLWSCPPWCIPSYGQPGHGWEGLGLHSPAGRQNTKSSNPCH